MLVSKKENLISKSQIDQLIADFFIPTASSALAETPKPERRQISWAPD